MLWSEGLGRPGSFWRDWETIENQMNRLFAGAAPSAREFPAINIWADGDTAVVTTELPGIDPGSIDMSVVGKTLTLRGERRPEEVENGTYHRRERWYGKFGKAIELPFDVDADKVSARFSKGVLYITLPKAETEKPRKINVKTE
ncbi:MAG TPA: molecular chaperone Hsp20 [Deltaproteobacteria bacterium]|nr:molecular chaperone Hsp20 [Deltaproteobacteria bacterium]